MKKNIIYAALLILIFSSCSFTGSDTNRSKIIGQWRWIKSVGGFGGITITPDSTGYTQRHIVFTSNKTFNFYRADTLFRSGAYGLRKSDDGLIINYHAKQKGYFSDQIVSFSSRDTLILLDRRADCYIST